MLQMKEHVLSSTAAIVDDCISAPPYTREELNQFMTAVNSFHPALKYTWKIFDTSLVFLDLKVSIEGKGLCTSMHYKRIDSHSYCCIHLHVHHMTTLSSL